MYKHGDEKTGGQTGGKASTEIIRPNWNYLHNQCSRESLIDQAVQLLYLKKLNSL